MYTSTYSSWLVAISNPMAMIALVRLLLLWTDEIAKLSIIDDNDIPVAWHKLICGVRLLRVAEAPNFACLLVKPFLALVSAN